MKPSIFTIFLFFILIDIANAQLDKGYWLTGGDASFISDSHSPYNSTNTRSNNTEVAPIMGYFFFDKFSAGIKFDFNFNRSSYGTSVNGPRINLDNNTYQFGPYFRYYFLNKDKIVNLFVQADYEYGINHPIDAGVNQKNSTFQQMAVMAGPSFFFTPSVALEFTGGYYYSFEGNQHERGLKMGIGFMIHLERQH